MQNLNLFTRRRFIQALAAASGASLAPAAPPPVRGETTTEAGTEAAKQTMAKLKHGAETILILIYPGFTAIDAIAPQYMLAGMMGSTVRLVAKTNSPVKCESGYEISPQLSFDQCPARPTLLIVPGGTSGTLAAIEDSATLDFIRRVGGAADMAGSVCTGSLLLGAAGLLRGYEATSHWQTLELLPLVGAKPSEKRVVFDRNRVTGAGVTAGLDFALDLVRFYRGDFYAKGMQLLAQYDPQPVFPGGGNPRTADAPVKMLLDQMHKPFVELFASTIQKAQAAGPN
jgi:cyclohexyl-isocyanide hydratase